MEGERFAASPGVRTRERKEIRALRGAETLAILRAINPIVRGWAAYHQTVVSKEVSVSLDSYLWQLTHRWALHRHPKI
ncbi:group II intron maturase-specific domain-containing protein [Streptomyces sp. NPDC047515]|uniref:group II intron maturase-specific domain-containing protein n=1 Tax=Streptomyces sp. NPDC047515 TaxID=3155380 RepID=UPI0033C120E2